ncbi:hypothetical protein FACS1894109_17220 [Spirochaetia bacterium]|nr:hypothetical protein FACS1894109_17220 [Spirochaetia bacterium]
MKKFSLLVLMMVALAGLVFAQTRDSSVVVQWDGTSLPDSLVYHLEVWDQRGQETDIAPFLNPINGLRKYGPVTFLIHANNGYIVALYASPSWESSLTKPQGVVSRYTVTGDSKEIIRSELDSKLFKRYITRSQFLTDLEATYAGLK